MVKKVNLELMATEDNISAKRNFLVSLFEEGYQNYTYALRQINFNNKQEILARKTLEILTLHYSTNGKNFEELLRMDRKLLSYELAREKAKSDLNASVAFIEFLMGK